MIIEIITAVYLTVMSVLDIKYKHIPITPGVVCMGSVFVTELIVGVNILSVAAGLITSVLLYLISRLSKGGIGEADALVYGVSGVSVGFYKNMEILFIALVLSAIAGGFLLAAKKVSRKYRMPFVPFTLAGYMMVVVIWHFL